MDKVKGTMEEFSFVCDCGVKATFHFKPGLTDTEITLVVDSSNVNKKEHKHG